MPEKHYTVAELCDEIQRDIDDAWEDFLNQASCHFHPELEALVDDLGLEPIEEDDCLPF